MYTFFTTLFNNVTGVFSLGAGAMPAAVSEGARHAHNAALQPGEVAGLILIIVGILLIVVSVVVLVLAAKWRIFTKAGQPGWAVFVPFYNSITELQMVSRPLWWVVLLCVPPVSIVIGIMMVWRLSKNFGHGSWFAVGLLVLPFIFYPILAFGDSEYKNIFPKPAPMSDAVKWSLIGLLAWAIGMIFWFGMSASSSRQAVLVKINADNSSGDGSLYSTDGAHVYRDDELILGADAGSFKLLGEYALDNLHVYFGGAEINGADPDSFSILAGGLYAKDKNHEYFEGDILKGQSDPASLIVFDSNNDFAKDSTRVYCYGHALDSAVVDVASFVPLSGSSYAVDKNHVYIGSDVVTGADRTTFKVVDGYLNPEKETGYYDAKDSKHYYAGGEVVR